ncbi:SusD/RagB family nutrient-binding outer membrane lipoprotein [Chitinophaga sp. Cy-1792]|uniref:SusD/RagB family nutrient-binding outer membrane lipoprotein n=1 Tax=Chitinophaga sp. Cy-1792 TaxID=2608339 RepID=UPI0014239226|nr:SusD/RagB family nutrient-binding outer membrane lipoprotein [Chitinophaga sp. Cy-1792]NIG55762.1 SusD/RagB family nutrient-binding outer membrane lipoprotein [Chitinophaga sp. Cy-1792]
MKITLYKSCYVMMTAMLLASCTKNFESLNTNPAGVTEDVFKADFQQIILPLVNTQKNIVPASSGDYQLQQNLNADIYSGYMMTPTPFNSGINNSNYFMMDGWNVDIYNVVYNNVLQPLSDYKRLAATYQGVDFSFTDAMAKTIKVLACHRTADVFGPIIYTKYGQANADLSVDYDSQQDAYNAFFKDLDTAATLLKPFTTGQKTVLSAFNKADIIYGGNPTKWLKLVNTLRLRLAIRIIYADKATAKLQGEKALDPASGGLITANADNAIIDFGQRSPIDEIVGWGDIRSGAPLTSYLNGYSDPRMPHMVAPATVAVVAGKYIGIRNGVAIDDKNRYGGYSIPLAKAAAADYFDPKDGKGKLLGAAETYFLMAEAGLNGWTGAGKVSDNYHLGITTSFAEWAAGSSADYENDNTSTAAPYVDPQAKTAGANDVPLKDANLSTITIKWDDAATPEKQLERIITQKWIAIYPDGEEAWTEFRRTGYPKLFPVVINNSGGLITGFIRRLPIPSKYQSNNKPGYDRAVLTLKGPDNGGTKLWWDSKP